MNFDFEIDIELVSDETGCFSCPKCCALISPENGFEYLNSDVDFDDDFDYIYVRCKGCNSVLRLKLRISSEVIDDVLIDLAIEKAKKIFEKGGIIN